MLSFSELQFKMPMFFTWENFKSIFLCFDFFETAAKISEERLKFLT